MDMSYVSMIYGVDVHYLRVVIGVAFATVVLIQLVGFYGVKCNNSRAEFWCNSDYFLPFGVEGTVSLFES